MKYRRLRSMLLILAVFLMMSPAAWAGSISDDMEMYTLESARVIDADELFDAIPVPEPSTMILVGAGMMAIGGYRKFVGR